MLFPANHVLPNLLPDGIFSSILETLPNKNFTVIYTTTPPPKSAFSPSSPSHQIQQEPPTYEWPDQTSLLSDNAAPHMDLKRSVGDPHHRRANESGNVTLPSGPLFNRYQYLTPGLFMAFLVAFPLLLILYVAINSVASLQVSYGAFEKETGPQSSQVKKGQ